MSLLLLLIAIVLKILLSPVLIAYGIVKCVITGAIRGYKTDGFRGIFTGPYAEAQHWIRELAISMDQMGNVMGTYLFSDLFRKKGGYDAGDRLDTISYFLGANQEKDKLTKAGEIAVTVLDALDDGHAQKAYEMGNDRLKNKLFEL